MANKLTRIQFDTGMKDFMPKTSFTDEDIRKSDVIEIFKVENIARTIN